MFGTSTAYLRDPAGAIRIGFLRISGERSSVCFSAAAGALSIALRETRRRSGLLQEQKTMVTMRIIVALAALVVTMVAVMMFMVLVMTVAVLLLMMTTILM